MTKNFKLKIISCFILLFTVVLTACANNESKRQESDAPSDTSTNDTETSKTDTTVADADEWYGIFAIDNFSYNSVTTAEETVIDEGKLLFDSGKCAVTDKSLENNNIPVTFYRVRIGN